MFTCLLVRHNEGNQEQAEMHPVGQSYTDHLHNKVDKQYVRAIDMLRVENGRVLVIVRELLT